MVAASRIPNYLKRRRKKTRLHGRFPRMLKYNSLVNENNYSDPYVVFYLLNKILITYIPMRSGTDLDAGKCLSKHKFCFKHVLYSVINQTCSATILIHMLLKLLYVTIVSF